MTVWHRANTTRKVAKGCEREIEPLKRTIQSTLCDIRVCSGACSGSSAPELRIDFCCWSIWTHDKSHLKPEPQSLPYDRVTQSKYTRERLRKRVETVQTYHKEHTLGYQCMFWCMLSGIGARIQLKSQDDGLFSSMDLCCRNIEYALWQELGTHDRSRWEPVPQGPGKKSRKSLLCERVT